MAIAFDVAHKTTHACWKLISQLTILLHMSYLQEMFFMPLLKKNQVNLLGVFAMVWRLWAWLLLAQINRNSWLPLFYWVSVRNKKFWVINVIIRNVLHHLDPPHSTDVASYFRFQSGRPPYFELLNCFVFYDFKSLGSESPQHSGMFVPDELRSYKQA